MRSLSRNEIKVYRLITDWCNNTEKPQYHAKWLSRVVDDSKDEETLYRQFRDQAPNPCIEEIGDKVKKWLIETDCGDSVMVEPIVSKKRAKEILEKSGNFGELTGLSDEERKNLSDLMAYWSHNVTMNDVLVSLSKGEYKTLDMTMVRRECREIDPLTGKWLSDRDLIKHLNDINRLMKAYELILKVS